MIKIDSKKQDNRLPSIPDGIARISFGATDTNKEKLILDVPCWVIGYTKTGVPRTETKFKRLQTSDPELVAKFKHAVENGWYDTDTQGNMMVDVINISYFDTSFQTATKQWINFSKLVSADIAPVDSQH